ncbi:stage II sporulation protein M [Natronorubrum thiooxidans]|uniref:Uncharacterized membrane protein SpoIIM, required for sporulation n=1 Tax=Natronorubrum thiooxidans TaxID=308853 RepID=A0A1N7EUD6_9EURY|nr:stage II sporulation protein M [Natronorubrum thiooxidans]SIR91682.1 Uncharacterized membrane protein SpoIIM, required for sporulation [Natronorubrum thiooxidans]
MNERGADREGRRETGTEHHTEDDRGESQSEYPTVDPGTDTEETPSSPGPGPDTGGDAEPPEPPDSATIRRWTGLTAALAVIAFVTAATILAAHAATRAAAGAAVLGLGLGAIAVVGRTTPTVFGMLDDAWAEHRPYVWFSAGVFAVGGVIGVLLYAAGIDLTDLFLEMIMEEFGEDDLPGEGGLELSASFFIMNNTPPFLAAIAGAITLGAVTLLIMVFNGVLVGNIVAAMGAQTGLGVIFALLVPHGIFELPALFVAAGVGFRFVHRIGQRIAGSRASLVTKRYLAQTAALVGFAWLLLVLAAFVEAYVTGLLADALVAV